MALVTLTDAYGALNGFPPDLLRTEVGVVMGAHTATEFSFSLAAGTEYAGFTITATGTHFTYDGKMPAEGVMSGLTIHDAGGALVMSVTGIGPGTLPSDLSAFGSYLFGFTDGEGNAHAPDPRLAWSILMAGSDTILGSSGDDKQTTWGINAGNDLYQMGAGNDWVNGGLGNDTIGGGAGFDVLDYGQTSNTEGIAMVRGITVNAKTSTILDPFGFTDTFTEIEEIHGTSTRDRFVGGVTGINFMGLRGADTIIAGSSGNDWALYHDDHWLGGKQGIVARLQVSASGGDIHGTIKDGFGSVDATTNITNVSGTRYNDKFFGSDREDVFAGGEGKDSYNGGRGLDWIDFSWTFTNQVMHGVTVNLGRASGQVVDDGFGNTEDAISIERVFGSDLNDRLIGSAQDNVLEGRRGDDTMTGGGGSDAFSWHDISEIGFHDVVTDFHAGAGPERDRVGLRLSDWIGSTTYVLVNGAHATQAAATVLFNPKTHVLSWDDDGTGAHTAVEIVTLTGVTALTTDNILIF